MPGLLVSHQFNAKHGTAFVAGAQTSGIDIELLVLPPDPEARIADADAARADIAYFSSDIFPNFARQFFSATRKAPALKWMQVFNAGVDHPVFASVIERGVRLTTSSGTAAEPIAQTAIAGMLMLARKFPRWLAGQRERQWNPLAAADFPRDLRGQTMLVYGLGAIGIDLSSKPLGQVRPPSDGGGSQLILRLAIESEDAPPFLWRHQRHGNAEGSHDACDRSERRAEPEG